MSLLAACVLAAGARGVLWRHYRVGRQLGRRFAQIRLNADLLRHLASLSPRHKGHWNQVQRFRLPLSRRVELEALPIRADRHHAERDLAAHHDLFGHLLAGLDRAQEQRAGADGDGRFHASFHGDRHLGHIAVVGLKNQMFVDVSGGGSLACIECRPS